MNSFFMIFLCLLLVSFVYNNDGLYVTLSTRLGDIRGINDSSLETPVYLFKGIPYAIPPIANLRFRPSTLLDSTWIGVRDATQFGDQCIQPSFVGAGPISSEDCLNLNIWTSNIVNNDDSDDSDDDEDLLPVMVWIHGGGFMLGSGSSVIYESTNIVGNNGGDFVVVTINYRLGPLGFLQNEEIYNEGILQNWPSYGGMNGINDQIVALKWIKKNIADYGGNPNKITINGESAGGLSICTLLLSDLIPKNMFDQAIISSAACNGGWGPRSFEEGLFLSNDILTTAGYPTTDLSALRALDAQTFTDNMISSTIHQTATWYSVDGHILSDLPSNIISDINNNIFNTKRLMIGVNNLDAIWGSGPQPNDEIEYESFVTDYVTNIAQKNDILYSYYPTSNFPPFNLPAARISNSYHIAWFAIRADVCLICPTLSILKQLNSNTGNTGYNLNNLYFYVMGGTLIDGEGPYTLHGLQPYYVFDKISFLSAFGISSSQSLADEMIESWINFVIDGHPNSLTVNWPKFSNSNQNAMIFNDNDISIKTNFASNYRNNVCDFWQNQIGQTIMAEICENNNPF